MLYCMRRDESFSLVPSFSEPFSLAWRASNSLIFAFRSASALSISTLFGIDGSALNFRIFSSTPTIWDRILGCGGSGGLQATNPPKQHAADVLFRKRFFIAKKVVSRVAAP